MAMSRTLLFSLIVTVPLGLDSCGTVEFAKKSTAALTSKAAHLARFPNLGIPDLFPAPVKIVKVRDEDLRDLPLGHDRALAFERKRQYGDTLGRAPADFIQPDLPQPGEGMDGSLLPPKGP
jgi:hypothetical protein